MRKVITIFCTTLIVSSCDNVVTYNYFIDNELSSNLNIIYENFENIEDRVLISGSEKLLFYTSEGINDIHPDRIENEFIFNYPHS